LAIGHQVEWKKDKGSEGKCCPGGEANKTFFSFIYHEEYKPRAILDVANTRMIIPSSYEGDMKIVQIDKTRRILGHMWKSTNIIFKQRRKSHLNEPYHKLEDEEGYLTQDTIEKEEKQKLLIKKLERRKEKKKQKKNKKEREICLQCTNGLEKSTINCNFKQ